MQITGWGKLALFGRDPKVGGSCVENNTEGLERSSDSNFTIVLGVQVVMDFDFRIAIKLGFLVHWEDVLDDVDDSLHKWASVHVIDEHLGFSGSSNPVCHLDLLDVETGDCQEGKYDHCFYHEV